MTHDQLKKFHSELYHPSNATFITYGDLNFISHLQEIQDLILSKTERKLVNSKITIPPSFDLPLS